MRAPHSLGAAERETHVPIPKGESSNLSARNKNHDRAQKQSLWQKYFSDTELKKEIMLDAERMDDDAFFR